MSEGTLAQMIEAIVDRRFDERFAELLGQQAPTTRPQKRGRPAPPHWTAEEKAQVIRDALSGMTLAQMSRKYGRSVGAIRLRLYGKKAGLFHDAEAVKRAMMDDPPRLP